MHHLKTIEGLGFTPGTVDQLLDFLLDGNGKRAFGFDIETYGEVPQDIVEDSLSRRKAAEHSSVKDPLWFVPPLPSALDPMLGKVRLMQFCWEAHGVRYVHIHDLLHDAPATTVDLCEALHATDAIAIIHYANFEQKWFMHHFDVVFPRVFCTSKASRLIHNGNEPRDKEARKGFHGLKRVLTRHLGSHAAKGDEGASDWSTPELTMSQLRYAANDVFWLPDLYKAQREILVQEGLMAAAAIEFMAVRGEVSTELNGISLDMDKWLELARASAKKAVQLQAKLLRELPVPGKVVKVIDKSKKSFVDQWYSDIFIEQLGFVPTWNLRSKTQLKYSLQRMGIYVEDTKELTLKQIEDKYPIITDILEFRKWEKRATTYGYGFFDQKKDTKSNRKKVEAQALCFPGLSGNYDPVPGETPQEKRSREKKRTKYEGTLVYEEKLPHTPLLHRATNRIHTDFFGFLDTGRYSTARPNMQNIPSAKEYRACFVPAKGNVFVSADWSAVEMRMAAQITQCPHMLQVFRDDLDAHTFTASMMSGVPQNQIPKDSPLRKSAKAFNFGLMFFMGPAKFQKYLKANYGITYSIEECEEKISIFFDKVFPGLKSWHEEMRKRSREHYPDVRTLSGRRRYMNWIPRKAKADDPPDAPTKVWPYSQYVNNPVQGSAAEVLKIALGRLHDEFRPHEDIRGVALHVHDEITVECRDNPETIKKVSAIMDKVMVEAHEYLTPDVPGKIDLKVGYSWAEVH